MRWLLVIAVVGCVADVPAGEPWQPLEAAGGQLAQPDDAPIPARLRVTTFNVELAADVPALAAAIEGSSIAGTDVMLVQEIEDHPREGRSRAAALAEALGLGYAYAPAREVGDGGSHGLALLSRYPMSEVQVMELPRVDLPVRPRRRIALAATIAGVRFVVVHLDTRIGIVDRILQLRPAILEAGEPAVVGGDFNTNPYAWTGGLIPDLPTHALADTDQAPLLDDYMAEAGWDTPTAGSGATQDAIVTRLRLDALYTRGLDTRATGVDRGLAVSDHWPLWIDVVQRAR